MSYVIARPQWFINDQGTRYTRGWDQRTVVGYGRTLRAAASRAGAWGTVSGYRVFNEQTGEDLGVLVIHDLDGYGSRPGRFAYETVKA